MSTGTVGHEATLEAKCRSDETTPMSGIDFPPYVFDALEAPEDERESALYRELAVSSRFWLKYSSTASTKSTYRFRSFWSAS